ncbi:MAG: 50S ribosomal protein L15 [Deltaproteobacteria bacterium GWA2_54_12]|uniref:Large ribosomal subunit protein uL15 n=1 Tax=uncultured delta proteobacterium Rifle_16ft_4_minimus_12842 TaxID=1665174 RepID=A0A0H4T0H8_9DELT|nr:50S ribosomal protein L15, large subunit ribosomal protein L15 [uncultured delta proteobacterium Rifle_16ft_4_minimus_12842]OGP15400.1 MAG: 50S ribosomal protein L15 [Deltaproteobacteria bacterium GWA2_54_12]
MLDRLKAPKGANQKKTRRGRGEGSGLGKTSGRGGKGQTARSGGNIKPGFEGGQMPLQRKLPKRGFTNIFRTAYQVVNIGAIAKAFKAGETVDPASILDKGLIKRKMLVKILGEGEITVAVTVKANSFSKSAIDKITAAGGVAEVI